MDSSQEPQFQSVDTSVYVQRLGEGVPVSLPQRKDRPSRVLVLMLVGSVGFLAGTRVQSAATRALAARQASSSTTVAATGVPPGGESVVLGRIKSIDGNLLYLVDPADNVTKVLTLSESAFTSASPAAIGDLRPGDTVVVSGKSLPDGMLVAGTVADVGSATGSGG